MKKRNGFTLIEVLIVLVIIALLTVGALTVLNTYRGTAEADETGRNNAKVAYGLAQECYGRGSTYAGCETSTSGYVTGAVGTWTATDYCFYSAMSGTKKMVVSDGRPNGVISTTTPTAINTAPCY